VMATFLWSEIQFCILFCTRVSYWFWMHQITFD
jgi:hypothetical protein